MAVDSHRLNTTNVVLNEYTTDFLAEHPSVKGILQQLLSIQSKHRQFESELLKEALELQRKFHARVQSLYNKRFDIVSQKSSSREAADDAVENMKNFWLTVLKNNPTISESIEEEDEPALRYLRDIRIEYFDELGFRLSFEFAENEFFTNKILTKTFYYEEDQDGYACDLVHGKAVGETIKWKKGMNLTEKESFGDGETTSKASFFEFFESPNPINDDEDYNEEGSEYDDEDDRDFLIDPLERDFKYGEEIKEKIIPYAVYWYTGEARLYEDTDEREDEEYEEAEESDDND